MNVLCCDWWSALLTKRSQKVMPRVGGDKLRFWPNFQPQKLRPLAQADTSAQYIHSSRWIYNIDLKKVGPAPGNVFKIAVKKVYIFF